MLSALKRSSDFLLQYRKLVQALIARRGALLKKLRREFRPLLPRRIRVWLLARGRRAMHRPRVLLRRTRLQTPARALLDSPPEHRQLRPLSPRTPQVRRAQARQHSRIGRPVDPLRAPVRLRPRSPPPGRADGRWCRQRVNPVVDLLLSLAQPSQPCNQVCPPALSPRCSLLHSLLGFQQTSLPLRLVWLPQSQQRLPQIYRRWQGGGGMHLYQRMQLVQPLGAALYFWD
jgi:hypothetical protein